MKKQVYWQLWGKTWEAVQTLAPISKQWLYHTRKKVFWMSKSMVVNCICMNQAMKPCEGNHHQQRWSGSADSHRAVPVTDEDITPGGRALAGDRADSQTAFAEMLGWLTSEAVLLAASGCKDQANKIQVLTLLVWEGRKIKHYQKDAL